MEMKKLNTKRNNNNRIYEEYVSTLNDLIDKWTSLRLVEDEERKVQTRNSKSFVRLIGKTLVIVGIIIVTYLYLSN